MNIPIDTRKARNGLVYLINTVSARRLPYKVVVAEAYYMTMDSKRERSSLVTLLSGLDLKEEEIQRFEHENIDLESFVLLSDYDLIEIGIRDHAKREAIMKVVSNLRSRGAKKKEVIRIEPLSWKEGLVVVANIDQHLDLLSGVMMYLRSQQRNHPRKCPVTVGFLDKEWSSSMALLACAAMAVSQSHYACGELEQLKWRVAGTVVEQKSGQYSKTTRVASLFITSIVIVGFVLWKTNSLPMSK